MRHYGGVYRGCDEEYPSGYGFDQLANAIHLIKTDSYSRRIIIDLWNPATQDKAALPSCLCKYQFNVDVAKGELNLAIYLRSSDYFLANNWNTCTGALLVHMICSLEGVSLTPGELTVFIADAHIYKSHMEQVRENLRREPYPFPKLIIKPNIKPNIEGTDNATGKRKNIEDFRWEDIELIGYRSHPSIKADMAV
jgi:thymidylate synthase